MNAPQITFGDKVRIRSTIATKALGLAGQMGIVHGHTTPSVTGVEVIGEGQEDYAIGVMIEGRSEALWFVKDLLEFVDHQPGTTINIGERRLTRNAQGEWLEVKRR